MVFFWRLNWMFNENKRAVRTWTLDSGKLILSATSSRIKISGYLVFVYSESRISSWARVNVVRSLRCFRGFTPENINRILLVRLLKEELWKCFIHIFKRFNYSLYLNLKKVQISCCLICYILTITIPLDIKFHSNKTHTTASDNIYSGIITVANYISCPNFHRFTLLTFRIKLML